MHFAAGVVFAVVAVELLPDLVHEQSVVATVIGFTLGTLAMLGVRTWNERSAGSASQRGKSVSGTLIAATAADLSVDGLMLGVGFTAGAKQGHLSRVRILWRIILLAGIFLLSAGLGGVALSLISGIFLAGVIAFGAAALLFLVTEELLTEAHQVKENPFLTSAFFVGFLALFVLELLR
jgi:ZIP family zinc transporter